MAARFWLGTTSSNWGTTANWSTTSGGGGGAAVPTASDDVTLDSGGNHPCDTVSGTRVCLSFKIDSTYTSTFTLNATSSGALNVSGNITLHTNATLAGSGRLRMIASGTFTSNATTVPWPFEIGNNSVATMTFTLADALNISNSLTMTCLTSTTFAGAFNIAATSASVEQSQIVTLSGNVSISGTTTIANGSPAQIDGAFNWNTFGLTINSGIVLQGSATIVFNGTGTWQWSGGSTASTINYKFDTGSSTLTLSGGLFCSGNTITHVSGTVASSGSTLTLSGNVTLDTAGMSWDNITLTVALTLTLSSLLSATGTLKLPDAAITFAGTGGWTVGTFTNVTITSTRIWTFHAGATYTITSAFTTVNTASQAGAGTRFTFVSSSPGTAVNFVLGSGASQDVGFVDPTDMDATAGQTIFTYHGVISASPNWTATVPAGGVGGGVRSFAYAA